MIVIQVIAGIVGYIIISTATTIFFIYADRKAGKTAQKAYKEDNFYEYCVLGFLFPLSLLCAVVAGICKFIKIMCVAIVETKIATEESENKQVGCIFDEPLKPIFVKLVGIARIVRIGEMKKQIKKKVRMNNVFGVAYCSECDFELRIDNANFARIVAQI